MIPENLYYFQMINFSSSNNWEMNLIILPFRGNDWKKNMMQKIWIMFPVQRWKLNSVTGAAQPTTSQLSNYHKGNWVGAKKHRTGVLFPARVRPLHQNQSKLSRYYMTLIWDAAFKLMLDDSLSVWI